MHALVRFASIAACNQFSTRDLREPATEALGFETDSYSLASLLRSIPAKRQGAHSKSAADAPLTTGLLQSSAGDS